VVASSRSLAVSLVLFAFGVRSAAAAGIGRSGGTARVDLRRFGGDISDFDGFGLRDGFARGSGSTSFPLCLMCGFQLYT